MRHASSPRATSRPIPQIRVATPEDVGRYIDLLEEVAVWLTARGIRQWRPGMFRDSVDYYAASIGKGEVHLAYVEDVLVGTLRVLLDDPIAWPEASTGEAVYVYNLAVKREWAGRALGNTLLDWATAEAARRGRRYVRLDCVAANTFLPGYYTQRGFVACGEVDAHYPRPAGTFRLKRFERTV